MRFGFVGPSYTARSSAAADEECINLFAETAETQGSVSPAKAYGGSTAESLKNYFWTPGIKTFATLPESPARGGIEANGRVFEVGGTKFCEVLSDGSVTVRGTIANDSKAVSLAFNAIQIFIVSAGSAYCFDLATNTLTDQTAKMAATPVQCAYADTYFIVCFANSNKYQISDPLDGTSWPGLNVNEVSVFPGNIRSIIVNHRELWILGDRQSQTYQNTGSANIFDVVPGALIETGCAATFSPCKLDNSIFAIHEDERGARAAWRSNGYTPQRISTHAVEIDLQSYADISGMTSYSYQDGGHLFWVLYVPGAQWSWVYDVGEQMWHKRSKGTSVLQSHWGWNHVWAFGKHLIGDWASGKVYDLSVAYLDDAGNSIKRLRRAPTIIDEMQWIICSQLIVDLQTGLGPQPPLLDGAGNPRAPQCMLRWSDDRGKTWSNEHWQDCGQAGEYQTRVIWRRLGRFRYRIFEWSATDSVAWTIVGAYLNPQ